MRSRSRSCAQRHGFTLVELIVAVAVLAVLVMLVAAMVNSTGTVIKGNRKHMDADGAARQVLDRIAADLGSMIKRRDLNYIFLKKSGNDSIYFFGQGPALADPNSGDPGSTALIGYRINKENPYFKETPVLERLGKRLPWEGSSSMVFLAYNTGGYAPETTLAGKWQALINAESSEFYHAVNAQVFRMEFSFLLKSGTYTLTGTTFTNSSTRFSNLPTAASESMVPPLIAADFSSTGNLYGFPPDLAAIMVTIAVLDDDSRKIVDGTQIDELGKMLADSTNGEAPAVQWQSAINNNSALSKVRVYQRLIYFDPR